MAVRPLMEEGIAEEAREGLAFALLAWWHHRGHPGALPSVTGAAAAARLGVRADPQGPSTRGAAQAQTARRAP
jgi:anhydro-N-acetylmuramic acid kinase